MSMRMGRPSVLKRVTRAGGQAGAGAYTAVLSLVVLGASGAIGIALTSPWLFPSLGPTVMLIFGSPQEKASRPLNAAVGHAVAIVAGLICLYLFGMAGKPPAPVGGPTPGYVLAGAVSVALTAFVLHVVKLPHPPAGATTLIVSLGIIATPPGILSMAAAIAFTIVAGWGINWLLGERLRRGLG
ncbi:HPP family protein [Microbacterium sp. X-17]|uniref:HPP family protein n=1 Tax=Microbacterium sp. X-17 TaxID=3144404 RepID=UPI0031F4A825